MDVFDEIMTFVWFVIKKSKIVRFVVLIRGSFGDVLGIENQFFDIEKSNIYEFCIFFDLKISFFSWKINFSIKKTLKNIKKPGKIAKSAENANLPRIPIKSVEGHTA